MESALHEDDRYQNLALLALGLDTLLAIGLGVLIFSKWNPFQ